MNELTPYSLESTDLSVLEEAYAELSEQFVSEMLDSVAGRFYHLSEERRRVRIEEEIDATFRNAMFALCEEVAGRVFSRDYPEWDGAVEVVRDYASDLRQSVLEEAESV